MRKLTTDARSTEEVLARFRELRSRVEKHAVPKAGADARAAYQEAAAVLHVFALPQLRPIKAGRSGSPVAHIIDDTVPAVGWSSEGYRSLKLDVRRDALRRLGERSELRRALDANPVRQRTDVQVLFERWVESGKLDLARLSSQQLQSLRALCDWGLESFKGFPPKSEVERAWHRRSITAPFEGLADNFVGRKSELQALREFVGLSERSLLSRAEAFLLRSSSSFLLLQGQGGVGKTALIARFILDYFENPKAARFAFIYLPFDDFTLEPREPYTLVSAIGSQLEAQIGADAKASTDLELSKALASFRQRTRRYLDMRDDLGGRATQSRSQVIRLNQLKNLDQDLQVELVRLLGTISRYYGRQSGCKEAPALLVLDTFEEVEFRPERDLKLFWEFLGRLAAVPHLRMVLSGRGTVTHTIARRNPLQLVLGDLPESEAIELLEILGVPSEHAAEVTRKVGTDPLTLKIVARTLKDENPKNALIDIKTTKYGFIRLGPAIIRGQLYRRMLQHIHDPDVRSLAHPGMALRRVTPDIIKKFLATECGLGEVTQMRAEELFNALKREHTLVRLDGSGALRYREEIRGSMLALLNADRADETHRLHQVAADYYANRRDAISRAEEIYHLLMAESEDKSRLEKRWGNDLERLIASSSEELPPSGRVWLAEMMSIKIPEEVVRRGRADERERIVGRQVGRAFRLSDFDAALKILEEFPVPGPTSPLHALKARALMAVGRSREAFDELESVIEEYPPLGNQARLAELMWLTAQAAMTLRRTPKALDWLEHLCTVARPLSSRIPLIQALTEILGVIADPARKDRAMRRGNSALDARPLREELAAALKSLKREEGERESGLVRLALGRLGPDPIEPWKLWAPSVAYDLLASIRDQRTVLSPESGHKIRDILSVSRTPYFGRVELDSPNGLAEAAEMILKELDHDEPDRAAVAGLAEIFRAEDNSLAASTLGGLESIREDWEREGGPEAST
jgi:tetratricopeptide (TPR) repeat protein